MSPELFLLVGFGTDDKQGEKWQELRSVLTPELTSAKTMLQFLPELHQVTEDFTSLLRGLRDGGNTVHNFELLANKISLESE
uniref:Uncharacterized protein n=1 Tax=Timema poppense TaxID=170557 RepID=A0A7R9GZ46_TIMPO|nr:unnamed protein product [Timema poppensis]